MFKKFFKLQVLSPLSNFMHTHKISTIIHTIAHTIVRSSKLAAFISGISLINRWLRKASDLTKGIIALIGLDVTFVCLIK